MTEKFLIRLANAVPSWAILAITALLSFGYAIYTYQVSGTSDSMTVIVAAMFGFISSVSALRHLWHRNDKEDEEVARD